MFSLHQSNIIAAIIPIPKIILLCHLPFPLQIKSSGESQSLPTMKEVFQRVMALLGKGKRIKKLRVN